VQGGALRKGYRVVIPHLRAAEGGTADDAGTQRNAGILPAVSGGSPAPAEGETPSGLPPRRRRYIAGATELPWESWARCPCHGGVGEPKSVGKGDREIWR